MRSLGMLQIAGGVVAAGVVAAGATAMTGSGVVFAGGSTPGTTGDNQFVGGTVSQTINGATVNSIVLATDGTGTHTTGITVNVTGANGKSLTITPTGGNGVVTATKWKCTGDVTGSPVTIASTTLSALTLNNSPANVACITTDNAGVAAGYYDGVATVGLAIA